MIEAHTEGESQLTPPALPGDGIICFAHDWRGDPTSKTHIMRILSARLRVLWVDSIGMRRPWASARGLREVEPNLFVVSPMVLPLPRVRAAERLNTALLASRLRRACRRLAIHRPIVWSFMPNVDPLVGRLDEWLVIYHCVDEYAELSGVPRDALLRMEREMLRKSDLVFVSSAMLRAERSAVNPDTYLVRHGVDVDHFGKALDPATAVPEELLDLPRPVIGFFGLIADWVDVALIAALATEQPDWSFVLVGGIATDVRPIQGMRNVHLLGRKPYDALPAYCRGFDVGLVPFRMNALTFRANPLKLREYLAAGLPVVATPIPEVARYQGLVQLAEGSAEFIAAIERSLAERDPDKTRRRVEAMREESWNRRVDQMSAIIAAHARPGARSAVRERR